jgi:hypothetical protein
MKLRDALEDAYGVVLVGPGPGGRARDRFEQEDGSTFGVQLGGPQTRSELGRERAGHRFVDAPLTIALRRERFGDEADLALFAVGRVVPDGELLDRRRLEPTSHRFVPSGPTGREIAGGSLHSSSDGLIAQLHSRYRAARRELDLPLTPRIRERLKLRA